VDNHTRYSSASLLLSPTEVGGSRPALSSGLYIVAAELAGFSEERHYVIYWPEDSTWDDSAASSVSRNRVTFMRRATAESPILFLILHSQNRYLTKICDQVVALLSSEHSASIIWDEDNDTESMDLDLGDSDRLFTFEVAKTNEREEDAVSRPGFEVFHTLRG
jgi:hypothetical protein